jgi:DNA-binding XRE family transcriptional regulator
MARRVITVTRRRRVAVKLPWPPKRLRFYRVLGQAIQDARVDALMTQSDLAKRVGLSRGSVANIETGRQQLLLHQFVDFMRVLKLDAREMLP